MIRINENYLKLQSSYLFAEIGRRVAQHQKENPEKEIIKMGIGDVTRALPEACIINLENRDKKLVQMKDEAYSLSFVGAYRL